jgi:hypothetical protein
MSATPALPLPALRRLPGIARAPRTASSGRWCWAAGWQLRLVGGVARAAGLPRCQYVTVSAATRAELATLGIDAARVAIVHNGTPDMSVGAVPRTPQPSLVVLGRLVPHKQVEVALRTVAALADQLPGLTLVVAGQGWWEPQLREFAPSSASPTGSVHRLHQRRGEADPAGRGVGGAHPLAQGGLGADDRGGRRGGHPDGGLPGRRRRGGGARRRRDRPARHRPRRLRGQGATAADGRRVPHGDGRGGTGARGPVHLAGGGRKIRGPRGECRESSGTFAGGAAEAGGAGGAGRTVYLVP